MKQMFIVKNEFKIVYVEGRWNAWLLAGQKTVGRLN